MSANRAEKTAALYARVSTGRQKLESQRPDLERWAAQADEPVTWFEDHATGTKMARASFDRLLAEARAGRVSRIVVWRMDRLGRTVSGLSALFEELQRLKVDLISLRDGFDLATPAGRLVANVLASMAQFETEVRAERISAGIAAAKAAGKTWGGSKKGQRRTKGRGKAKDVATLYLTGRTVSQIARALGLTRKTVYSLLDEASQANQ